MKLFVFFKTWLVLLVLLLSSCVNDDFSEKRYIYISHTRLCNSQNAWSIDEELEYINYSSFDLILLGGDMLCQSSLRDSGMTYLDRIFKIGSKKTLWSIGNHDDDDLEIFKKYTKKNNYYSYFSKGVTFIVLDSEINDSKIINEQLKFVQNTLDTIETSKNIIIMTHKLLWLSGNEELRLYGEKKSNVKIGVHPWNIKINDFHTDIYPRLAQMKSTGINVICIAGDLGTNANTFEYITKEGVCFLANGIGDNLKEAKVLVISNLNNSISWEFLDVKKLKN
jgi:hypothetical protein